MRGLFSHAVVAHAIKCGAKERDTEPAPRWSWCFREFRAQGFRDVGGRLEYNPPAAGLDVGLSDDVSFDARKHVDVQSHRLNRKVFESRATGDPNVHLDRNTRIGSVVSGCSPSPLGTDEAHAAIVLDVMTDMDIGCTGSNFCTDEAVFEGGTFRQTANTDFAHRVHRNRSVVVAFVRCRLNHCEVFRLVEIARRHTFVQNLGGSGRALPVEIVDCMAIHDAGIVIPDLAIGLPSSDVAYMLLNEKHGPRK